MRHTDTWRYATAGLATAALLAMTAGTASAQVPGLPGLPGLPGDGDDGGLPLPIPGIGEDGDGDGPTERDGIPEAGMGGFSGYADASGTTVFIGLPAALADALVPLFDGLGVRGSLDGVGDGIRIDLGRVQSNLERAAAGEDVGASADALITNLLLGSELADQPGSCTGGPIETELPPDQATPVITLTLLGVDCGESDARAFADARIAGLDIRLGGLLEAGLPTEAQDGLQQVIDALNDSLLAPVSSGLCTITDPIFDVILPGAGLCEDDDPFLQLQSPLDLDVPLLDLDLIEARGEVTQDGDTVTATATSVFSGVNLLGVACVGTGDEPLVFTSTAASNGTTATRSASAPPLEVGLCQQDQSLLRTLLSDGPLGDIALLEELLDQGADGGLLDGALAPLFEGLDSVLEALTTQAVTQGSANEGPIEGAGTTASTDPFVVAQAVPFGDLPGLDALGDIAVVVQAGATEVGVNAQPAGEAPAPPADPDPDPTPAPSPDPDPTTPGTTPDAPERRLPRTGPGLGAVVGLGALAAAAALRRRRDEG